MDKLESIKSYLDIFHSGDGFDGLYKLFSDDLKFTGPFLKSNSAKEYVGKLKEDCPRSWSYEILYEFENENCASCVYKMKKDTTEIVVSQTFEFQNNLISKILTVFDSASC